MPRLRQRPGQGPGEVPVELLRRGEPLWDDPAASRRWFERHGLTPGQTFDVGPACRRKEAIWAWLVANGYGNPTYPKFPDWHRVNQLSIEGSWSADATRERLSKVKGQ
ncbi:hypothetical protein GCM10010921_20000 [Microbacterium album]|uniref:Uncharacterized protein n=1 Tax=Microbacterium album TaxID=2053191 RepID=A0A917IHM2_9MICO|nr:hypothetical protein GCM10010921_20000 [Microbacterium album]